MDQSAPAAPPAASPGAAGAAAPRLPRYRFVALGVVWSAYLVVFLSRLCVGPLAPFLKDAFDLSNAQIGGLTSATAVAYAPTLIFAGWLVDRIGVRRALLIGTVITGLCIGAVALAPSYGTMLLLLGASGLGCGFIYPTAVKAIMLWFPANERATAVGVNQSAVNVSGMLGAAIMPWLAVTYSWQAGFVFAAGLAFVVCVVAVLFYRDPRPGESPGAAQAPVPVSEIDQGLPAVTGDERTDREVLKSGFAAVLRSRDIWMMGLAALFLGVVEFAALAHLVLFLNSDWGFSVAVAAGMLAFCQFAGALGKPLSGLVSDRPLRRRRVPALLGMGTLAGLSCVAFALHPARPHLAPVGRALPAWVRRRRLGRPDGHAGRRDRRPALRRRGRRRLRRVLQRRHLPRAAHLRRHRRPHRLLHAGVVDDGRVGGCGPRAAAVRARGPHAQLRPRRGRRSLPRPLWSASVRERASQAGRPLAHELEVAAVAGCRADDEQHEQLLEDVHGRQVQRAGEHSRTARRAGAQSLRMSPT